MLTHETAIAAPASTEGNDTPPNEYINLMNELMEFMQFPR